MSQPPYEAGPPAEPNQPAPAGTGRRRGFLRGLARGPEWWAQSAGQPGLDPEWALQRGWRASSGDEAEDAPLAEVIGSAPMRLDPYHRARNVVRGFVGAWQLIGFDLTYERGKDRVVRYAVTTTPVLYPLPAFRLCPARFWKHGTGGQMLLPSGDQAFDTRWSMLAEQDDPALRDLIAEPVRAILLASEDKDEIWWGAGHIAIVRPDGHHPELLDWHTRVLTTMLTQLS